jgi:hypothetical protein
MKKMYMLVPAKHPETNITLKGAPGSDVKDLPAIQTEEGFFSLWYCDSFVARVLFLITGRIWFGCISNHHPPVSLMIGGLGGEPR